MGSREGADLFGPWFSDRAPSSEPAVCVRKRSQKSLPRAEALHSVDPPITRSRNHPIFSVPPCLRGGRRRASPKMELHLTKTPSTEHNFL